jgi:hypothetical protein
VIQRNGNSLEDTAEETPPSIDRLDAADQAVMERLSRVLPDFEDR